MKFHVLTLFPELIQGSFATSITGRAIEKGQITLNAVNIRDYAYNKHQKVDDYPYGGGAGMVMQAEPVYEAYSQLKKQIGNHPRVIYVTPQGRVFNQELAEELAKETELVFLCGHYEGIDERVLDEVVTDYVSIGDYVLTGGELPALVMMDAISRLVPGVLNNDVSAEFESFHGSLLEYPQYSRPEVWHGKPVPKELLSGNHKMIEAWRQEQSIARTKERRPDLYDEYMRRKKCEAYLLKQKLLHMDMLESLRADRGKLRYFSDCGVMLMDAKNQVCFVTAENPEEGERICETLMQIRSNDCRNESVENKMQLILHQKFLIDIFKRILKDCEIKEYEQWIYTLKNPLSLRSDIAIQQVAEEKAGECVLHPAGILNGFKVKEERCSVQVGQLLEKNWINQMVALGMVPVVWLESHEQDYCEMQKLMGLYRAKGNIWVLHEKNQ